MATEEQCRASLWHFEQKYHADVFEWLISKLPKTTDIDVLDISLDACTFGAILSERLKPRKFLTALRENTLIPCDNKIETTKISLANNDLPKLYALGPFDVVICKEMLHEIESLPDCLNALKLNMRNMDSRIFLLSRPKNPMLPLPDTATAQWRKQQSIGREQIIETARKCGFKEACYSCSAPIKIEKQEWHNILKGRFFPSVKSSPKCTDKEIRDYIQTVKGKFVQFEEKIFIYVLWQPTAEEKAQMDADRAQEIADSEVDPDRPNIKLHITVKDAPQAAKHHAESAEIGVQVATNATSVGFGARRRSVTPLLQGTDSPHSPSPIISTEHRRSLTPGTPTGCVAAYRGTPPAVQSPLASQADRGTPPAVQPAIATQADRGTPPAVQPAIATQTDSGTTPSDPDENSQIQATGVVIEQCKT